MDEWLDEDDDPACMDKEAPGGGANWVDAL